MNNLKDILTKSRQLRLNAKELLHDSKVVETLDPFGEVVLRGSFALDLMVVEDIDISVINPNADYRVSAIQALDKFVENNFFQSYHLYDWSKYRKSGFPTGFYLGLQVPIKQKKWKIDIWFVKENTKYEETIVPQLKNLSQEKRNLILQLKEYRNENKIDVSSANIYQLVSEGKLEKVGDLKNYL